MTVFDVAFPVCLGLKHIRHSYSGILLVAFYTKFTNVL